MADNLAREEQLLIETEVEKRLIEQESGSGV